MKSRVRDLRGCAGVSVVVWRGRCGCLTVPMCVVHAGMYYGTFFSNNVGDIECPAREQAVATGDFVYTPNPTLYQQYSDAQVRPPPRALRCLL